MAPLDYTLGAAFTGMLAAAILYGVTSVQTFLYFHDFKEDGRRLKTMVLFLWILDTIHLIFTCHGLYYYLVTNYGNYEALLEPTWTILAQVYLTNISDVIVRGYAFSLIPFLAEEPKEIFITLPLETGSFRDACLSLFYLTMPSFQCTSVRTKKATGMGAPHHHHDPLALVVFACGCGFASRSFVLKTYHKMNEAAAMLYISFACAVAADTIIAASLCTLLLKSRTGFKRTDSIITILMAFSINTGLITSICAIACLVTYAIWPQRFIFMGLYFALSKLYVNSLLASLNARTVFRSGREFDYDMSFGMGTSNRRVSTSIAFPKVKDSSQGAGTRGTATSTDSRMSDVKVSGLAGGSVSV